MFVSQLLIPLAALTGSTYALAFNGPQPTEATSPYEGDLLHPPHPTPAPHFSPELMKRQNVQVDLLAPDNTCGYISGLAGAAYYCYAVTDKCAFFPSTSGTWGFVGCCNTQNCGARLTCVDSSQYYSQTFCDNGCEKDTFTLKCTASTAPYCNGIRWPNEGVQDYFCDGTSVSTWQTALTTYSLQKGRSFSKLTVTLTTTGETGIGSTLPNPTDASTSGSATGGSVVSESSASTTTAPVPTTSEATKKSTPVGAIAGGAVGGVAVLAALGVGIFFFLRRKNKKPTDANNGVQPPAYAQGPGDSAYAATAAKPGPTAQEAQYGGAYGPQGYAPVPQQQYQQPYGQQPYPQQYQVPQMAEAPGNSNYIPGAAAAAAYDPHHSTISQGPATPYSQHSQPLSPNSASHLTGGTFPDRGDTTSPMSQTRMSVGGEGHSPMGISTGGSPPQQYQAYTPYVPPTAAGGQTPVEMSGTMAGPWPTNLHEGTYEAPGQEVHRPQQGHQ